MVCDVAVKMAEYFGRDTRRANHALKVYALARTIGEGEGLCSRELYILELAALLHDIGIPEAERKYGSADGRAQEAEGPPVAAGILRDCGEEAGVAERVCFLVGHHHSYTAIDGTDFQSLVEADFLVNLFEDGTRAQGRSSVFEKYFKTETGKKLFLALYPL